jgi:pSer/pThr/pTyr-binding forkhead associated (FHA) protein
MNVKLVVVQGKPEGKEIPLRTQKFLIGRGTECHLRPNSELISRHHCLLIIGESGVTLRDLGSTNGTLVNGERAEGDVAILHEDLIQVGPLGFRLVMEPVPATAPTTVEPAPATPIPQAATLVATTAKAVALRRQDAKDGEIEHWLVSDQNHNVPDSDSGVYDGDTKLRDLTTIEHAEGQDTKPEFTSPPIGTEPPDESTDSEVTLESGRKMKVGNARQKIEKTRDDTSRAAADILRRVMERKSSK